MTAGMADATVATAPVLILTVPPFHPQKCRLYIWCSYAKKGDVIPGSGPFAEDTEPPTR